MGELAMDDIWFGGQTKTLGICNKVLTDHPPARHRQLQDWYLCHWYRNLRLYCSTFCGVWCNRVASNIWQCCPNWGHEPCLDLRPYWTNLPQRWRLCNGIRFIHGSDTYDRASRTMPLTIRIRLNLKPKVYAKNYIDSLPDNSPEKLLSELCRMQVYRWWLLIFHPTYIRMICYYQFGMQNQLLLLTPHKIGQG
jgi:hypothetical protein